MSSLVLDDRQTADASDVGVGVLVEVDDLLVAMENSVPATVDGASFGKEKGSVGLDHAQWPGMQGALFGEGILEVTVPSDLARKGRVVDSRNDPRVPERKEQALDAGLLVPVDFHVPRDPSDSTQVRPVPHQGVGPGARPVVPRPGRNGSAPLEVCPRRHHEQGLRASQGLAFGVPGKGDGLEDVAFHVRQIEVVGLPHVQVDLPAGV